MSINLLYRLWLTSCLAAIALFTNGCGYRYANVYVRAVRKSTHSAVSMDMYSGTSGLHLGYTGDVLYLKKRAVSKDPPISLLIRGGADGCPTYWQIVKVEHWAKTRKEAGDATNKNDVQFIVKDADVDCN